LVAGEAGVGKTRLLRSVARSGEQAGLVLARAAAFPGDAEVEGALLVDLASDLRRADDPALRTGGGALAERLRDPATMTRTSSGDSHRLRRLLIQDLSDTLASVTSANPMLIILEDLHWADQLSLGVIRHLAGRIGSRAVLVVGAFRTDELYAATPAREWRTGLVNQRLAEEITLSRLTLAETATLVSAVVGGPADQRVVVALHERSDGIPLHIEELLAAAGTPSSEEPLDPATLNVPASLADAVLLRAAGLDATARDVAAAAAVIGRSFDLDLLTDVVGAAPAEVDGCISALTGLHLAERSGRLDTYDFRHALIRDALYADVPASRRRALHERVATQAVRRGYPAAFASAHYEAAGLAPDAYATAAAGAAEAAAISAHQEALRLYRRALRNLPTGASPEERARLLVALGDEAAATDDNLAAAEAYSGALALWQESGDMLAAASVVPSLTAVQHLLGDPLDRRVGRLEAAMSLIADRDDRAAIAVRANLLSGIAAAYMLDRRLDESIQVGEQALALSQSVDDTDRTLNTGRPSDRCCFSPAGWRRAGDAWRARPPRLSPSCGRPRPRAATG
jgi:predicted ATPase